METIDFKWPNFSNYPGYVQLAMAVDGFNPFRRFSNAYSVFLVVLVTYKLPPIL